MIGAQGGATLRQIDQLFGAGTVAGLSDAQLLERFLARRDGSAFEALVARHGPMVLAVCRGVLRDEHATEDAFQATFLILVRKAGAIRGRAALGGWLYRVAHRVALQANADARRRHEQERQSGIMRVASGSDDLRDDDRAAVHEEVSRLPERQRLPVVLCYLGGRTHAEAAAELRCGEATVRRRLADARERLRSRLSRRGVAPSIVLQIASSSWPETPAVPSARTATTAAAALRVATGQAITAGVVPASVAALALGALRASLVTRLRIGGAALLSVAAVAALAAGVATRDDPRPISAPEPPAAAPSPGPEPERETGEELTIRGQVLGPSGLPVARAKISLWMLEDYQEPDRDPAPCGESGPDGRFVFQAKRAVLTPRSTRAQLVQIVATAKGYGPAWTPILATGTRLARSRVPDELTLRLAEDFAITGRVLDLEGRPAAGARVGLLWLAIPSGGPENYLSAVRNQGPELKGTFPDDSARWIGRLPGQPAFIACDATGRFRMSGLGRDRVAELVVQGPAISEGTATVLTRPMPPVVGPVSRRLMAELPPPLTVYGAAFDYVASPSRPIVGVVRDRVTSAPLAGIRVVSERLPGKDVTFERMPGAITDATGGYVLHGHPKAGSYTVAAVPEPGMPYLVGYSRVADTPGTGPLHADMVLARGIPFRVRPVDAATGQPVVAEVSYYPIYPNPHYSGSTGYGAAAMGPLSRARANPDGSYSGVALPGPGAICIESHQETYLSVKINARESFKPGQPPADRFDSSYGNDWSLMIEQGEEGTWCLHHEQFQAIVLIDPKEDSGLIEREATLVPATKLEGTILGPEGQPLAGAEVYEADGYPVWTPPLRDATFMVTKVQPSRPRKVLFRHGTRKLAGVLIVPSGDARRPSVRLSPWATLTGRVVDAEGRPRPGLRLVSLSPPAVAANPTIGEFAEWVRTDEAGRFHVEGLIPGPRYSLNVSIDSTIFPGSQIFEDVILEPGETRDLGDVREESQRPRPSP